MATEYPATAIPGQGVSTFARLVAEKTGGRIAVQPSFDAAAGVKSAEMLDAVRSGRLQAGDAFTGSLAALDPIFGLSSLPFVVPSVEAAEALSDRARPSYARATEARGQRLLYVTLWPATGLWSKSPVRSLADLRALKVRAYDETSARVMVAAGAEAQNISFADTMPKLRDGTVDAVLSSGDGGAGRRLWDLLPHFTELNYALPLSIATVSAASYEALSPDLRQAVDAAAAETERLQRIAVRTRLQENYDRMRANRVTIVTSPDPALMAELARVSEPVVDAWIRAAGADNARLLDGLRAAR